MPLTLAPAYRCDDCAQVYFPTCYVCPACGAGPERARGDARSREHGKRRPTVTDGMPRGPWLTDIVRRTPLEPPMTRRYLDGFTGALVGTACGDAMGLLVEGQAPSAGERHADRLALANECGEAAVPYFSQVCSGRYSDDTQQARALVEVLRAHGRVSQDTFAERLAAIVREGRAYGWGGSSLRAVRKMVDGQRWLDAAAPTGECGAAPVMRVVPLGAWLSKELYGVIAAEAAAQAHVTHSDARTANAAILVAMAASDAVRLRTRWLPEQTRHWASFMADRDPDLARAIAELPRAIRMTRPDAVRWAASYGPGGSGDVVGIPGTAAPIALFAIRCWLRSLHAFVPGVLDAIAAGGDTDTAAAVTGGLLGATLGASRIPPLFSLRLHDVGRGRVGELVALCAEAWTRHGR